MSLMLLSFLVGPICLVVQGNNWLCDVHLVVFQN